MANQNKPHVVLLPEELLECNDVPLVKLKHPRTGTPMICVLGENHSLYEVVDYKAKYSSWFIGDKVVEDGGFHMLTPIDPTFFILMYLNKDGKYCPFEDCLVDPDYPDAKHLLSCCTQLDFEQVANVKCISNLMVYAYNKDKTLKWLKKKVEQSAKIMKAKDVCVSDDAKAMNYNPPSLESEKDKTFTDHSCRMMSDYLSEDLSNELFKMFGIELNDSSYENSGAENGHKEKKFKVDDDMNSVYGSSKENASPPEEDKKKTKMTASQKRLMKVDKTGMKSISSFFQKK